MAKKKSHTREWQVPDLVYDDPDVIQWHKDLVRQAETALAVAREALHKAERERAKIKCCNCGGVYPISDQIYIQTYWYTPPRSCNEGDYWSAGEANWECPGCGFRNRFEDKHPDRNWGQDFERPELVALRGKFKRIHECCCDDYSYGGQRLCSECKKHGMKGRYSA